MTFGLTMQSYTTLDSPVGVTKHITSIDYTEQEFASQRYDLLYPQFYTGDPN